MTSRPLFGAGSAPRKPESGDRTFAAGSSVPHSGGNLFGEWSATPGHIHSNGPSPLQTTAVQSTHTMQAPAQTSAPTAQPVQPHTGSPVPQQMDSVSPAAAPAVPAGISQFGAPLEQSAPAYPTAAQQNTPANGTGGSIEDRKQKRIRTLKGALIVLPGQMGSSYACKIRNQSRGGALVLVTNPSAIPDEIYLIWDADPGKKIPCRVAWRGHDRMGIEFVSQLTCE